MKIVLGTALLAFASALLLAFGGGQALATTVHCGDTITQNTTLDADLTNCPDNGLNIGSDGITISLNGHTIDGQGFFGFGINNTVGHDNVTVVGPGAIQEFGGGFYAEAQSGAAIRGVSFRSISLEAIRFEDQSNNNLVADNSFKNTDQNGSAIFTRDSSGNVYIRNTVAGFSGGIGLGRRSDNAVVSENIVTDNRSFGIATSGDGTLITRNDSEGNGREGIGVFGAASTVRNSTADHNGSDGITVGGASASVVGNHTWFNGNLGINALPDTTGSANWAKHNGNPLQCIPASLCSTTGKPKS